MFEKIEKRNGQTVKFEADKITAAIAKAGAATSEFGEKVAQKLTLKLLSLAQNLIIDRVPTVEEIQDVVEEVLLSSPYRKTARAYIIYREQHARIREISTTASLDLVDQYLAKSDWRVNENSNMTFSLQGLNNYISSDITAVYWLNKIYPAEIREAHLKGDFHIHDLSIFSTYCVGWDLFDLLVRGFGGVSGKVESKPAKHFRAALGQIANFFYTLQGESAGAQAFSNFDTLLSPFVRYDNLNFPQIRQALQEFIFNVNVPTRVGFQCISEDTEILTSDGWCGYSEVKEGSVIKTFNLKTKRIENQKVTYVFKKNYEGLMYNLKNRIQDQLVSPRHKVVRKKFQTDEYILEPIEEIIKLKSPFIVPIAGKNSNKKAKISNEQIKLMAWIISEGTIERPTKYRCCYRVSIYQSEVANKENCQEIINLLKKFKIKYSENESSSLGNNVKRMRLNAESSRKIHQWFGTKENVHFIPDILLNLNQEQSRLFLETYLKADGFENCKIATTDPALLDDLQIMVINAGYGFTILKRKPTIGKKEIYVLRIIKHQETYIQKVEKVNYKGVIWSPHTKNETIIARRKGKVFITGNTPFTNITLDLTPPKYFAETAVIIGGKPQKETYKEFQKEMDLINRAFLEVMGEGDGKGRVFTFPIPTYNITKDFDWENPNMKLLWQVTAKFGIPYFCLDENTEIFTDKGVKKIKNVSLKDKVLSNTGKLEKISFKKKVKSKESIILEGNDFSIICSSNHRFLTKDGLKMAQDLSLDNYLLQYKDEVIFENGLVLNNYYQQFFKVDDLARLGKNKFEKLVPKRIVKKIPKFRYLKNRFQSTLNEKVKIPDDLNKNLMELIGIILGDGSIRKSTVKITNADEEIINFTVETIKNNFGLKPEIRKAGKSKICKEISVNSVILVSFLRSIDLGGNTYTKRIPEICFWRKEKEISALLRGLFDTDGSINLNRGKNHIVSISFANNNLMNDVLVLLAKIGIIGKINKLGKKGIRLIITGERNIRLFREKVGFRIKRKERLLSYPCKNSKHPSIGDRIVSIEEAKKVSKFYAYKGKDFVRVKSKNECPYLFISSHKKETNAVSINKIERIKEERILYDLTVASKNHLFVLRNGVISHNSNFINSDMDPADARSMCLAPDENLVVKINNKIIKTEIGKLAEDYADGFDSEGWSNTNENIEALSLDSNTYKIKWTKVKRFLKINDTHLVTIKTRDGKEMKVSKNHLIAVYTGEGIKTKLAEELNEGDILLTTRSATNAFENNDFQKVGDCVVDEKLAYLIGFFIADGNYLYDTRYNPEKRPRGIQFTFDGRDEKLQQKIANFVEDIYNYDLKFIQDPRYENSLSGYIYRSEVAKQWINSGIEKYNKVPEIIFNSSLSAINAFLDGFFDGDGYKEGKEIHINDKALAKDLVILMTLAGINCTYREKENSQGIRIQHTLGRGAKYDRVVDTLYNRVPQFVVQTGSEKPFYEKDGMPCKTSLDRRDAQTDESIKILNNDMALVKIESIEREELPNNQDFYDIELERGHYFVHSLGNITHNCCRLRLDNRELKKRGGGLFGANPLTGSVGVVTINMAKLGYLAKNKEEFKKKLSRLMELAKESLEIKRKTLEGFTDSNLYPYSKYYLKLVKEHLGEYWKNHFSTIGLIGMNEACLNLLGENIGSKNGKKFALETLNFMREKLLIFQKETSNNYNLEATPAEGSSYRLAKSDRENYPDIICANEEVGKKEGAEPFYTNSTQLPVNYTDDIFEVLELQDELQTRYTGGCIEGGNKVLTDKGLLPIEYIVKNFGKLKPIKALSYNKELEISEWDKIVEGISIDIKKHNKIRIKGEKKLDITTSDWHPFFVLEKFKPIPVCPICKEKVGNLKGFAAHIRWNPECQEKYEDFPKYRVVEKRADELKVGDYILQNSYNLYPEKEIELNNDLMWLFGFFIGDGCISKFIDDRGCNSLERYKIRFFSEHQEALSKIVKILNKYFDCQVKVIQNDKRSKLLKEVSASKKKVLEFFFKYGFKSGKKVYDVSIPLKVEENITKNNIFSLLSGLMDSDGALGKRDGDFEYNTVSTKLAEDLLEILTKAGIMISKSLKRTKRKNEIDIWRLRIPQYELTRVKEKLTITVNRGRIKNCLSNRKKRYLPAVRVKEVSKIDVENNQFYDLTTEKNHNYLAGKDCLVFVHNTVIHFYLGERIKDENIVKHLVQKICRNNHLPYFTITPTFSVCPVCGYIPGEHPTCPKCSRETEVYSRVVGYLRPVKQWNKGKKTEFAQRKTFKVK